MVQLRPEDVAARLAVGANEIRDWEADRAQPDLKQLEQLAATYGREFDYFLKETPNPPSQIVFRSATGREFSELSEDARLVIVKFDELCRTAIELELMLGRPRPLTVLRQRKSVSPSALAREERERFRLGGKPVRNLKDILGEIGIRVYELAVPQNQFSGFSYWHSDYGPCILVNAKDVPGRRAFTLAHEYAHILHSDEPSVCDIGQEGRLGPTKEERWADAFAIDFLLPAEPVRQDFSRRGLSRQPSVREIGAMAGKWCVSVQAMAYRLEDLALIDEGHASRVLASYEKPLRRFGASRVPTWERRLGRSFVSQAMEAYHAGHISIGKLAHCLGLPIRKALEAAEQARGAQ